MWHMDNKCIWQDNELIVLCLEFHRVAHFVPTKPSKSEVKLGNIPTNNHVRFKILLPIYLFIVIVKLKICMMNRAKLEFSVEYLVWSSGRPPFWIITSCMTLRPDMKTECEKVPNIKHFQQISFSFWKIKTIPQGLKCRNNKGLEIANTLEFSILTIVE